jgi:uncharacterized protein YpuA (DUF1002 family)
MQRKSILISLSACVFAVAFTACDKKPAAETPAPATPPAATTTMDAAKDMAGKAADTAKEVAAKTVDTAKDLAGKTADTAKEAAAKVADTAKNVAAQAVAATTGTTDSATAQFTGIVTGVKKYITDNNYKGAVDELKKFSSLQLTADQQKIVDGLKAEVQKLIPATASAAFDTAAQLLKK